MKLSDAHVHLNMNSLDPKRDLTDYLVQNEVLKVTLLLNRREDFYFFKDYISKDKTLKNSIFPVVGLNRSEEFAEEALNYLQKIGKKACIKIHPRLFCIREEDLDWYEEKLCSIRPAVVVIDDFLYGNDTDMELVLNWCCRMAEEHPEILFVLAHSGGVNLLQHVMRTKTKKNIRYDISLTVNYLIASSVALDMQWFVKFYSDRIMLGSDYPDFTIKDAYRNFEIIAEGVGLSEEQKQNIIYNNMVKVYG